MNTNVVAELNEIRHQELLREAAHQRLAAKATQRREGRTAFRLPSRWRRTGSTVVRTRPA